MKRTYDLSRLEWTLSGWVPNLWRLRAPVEVNKAQTSEVPAIPARVPGSVQMALRTAGLIPDWNEGLNYRACQWVENLHWVYEASIPDEWVAEGSSFRLECLGLDGSGWLRVNGAEVAAFNGSHRPHVFDLGSRLKPSGNVLTLIFDCPPRWAGQFGYTSRMTEWKVRFNYTWDWVARLVQIGVWDRIDLVGSDGAEIGDIRVGAEVADAGAALRVQGNVAGPAHHRVKAALMDGDVVVRDQVLDVAAFNRAGIDWRNLAVGRWWPNGMGEQRLYTFRMELVGEDGTPLDSVVRTVGFRSVAWRPCEGAPPEADPWICVVNGEPVFLQGANWVPIRTNFADVSDQDYRAWLTLYRDLGFNILRVWGGAVLEKECFYALCDELGLMVWQEFPLSSSGCDDYPPEDETFIREMRVVAQSYVARRRHHASLVLWCGGNELITTRDGSYLPVGDWHPMIRMLKEVVADMDPGRRFLPTSPSGPSVHAHLPNFGKGIHWDVHGPWSINWFGMADATLASWQDYWDRDDALLRSETGNPGASPADIICRYRGECSIEPIAAANPLWRRPLDWWFDGPQFIAEHGRNPRDLEEYVSWSQERQARALAIAVRSCQDRFPRCGGILFWMGHDCYPCAVNTAIIDFHGRPKPAAVAVGELFRQQSWRKAGSRIGSNPPGPGL